MDYVFLALRVLLASVVIAALWWVLSALSSTERKKRSRRGIVVTILARIFILATGAVAVLVSLGVVLYLLFIVVPRFSGANNNRVAIKKVPGTVLQNTSYESEGMVAERALAAPKAERTSDNDSKRPKFRIRSRFGTSVSFVKKDGSRSGSLLVQQGDSIGTYFAVPVEDESYATIFPVRHGSECAYETRHTAGEYLPCKKVGSVRVGAEEWGVYIASYDDKK